MTGKRTYLDWNATTPLRPEARAAMLAALDEVGNASSVHGEGRHARAIVETAREHVAALARAKPSEVVFTSGGTEANNWAMAAGWDIIVRAGIEHDSVLAPAHASGAENIGLDVDTEGQVLLAGIASASAKRRGVLALQLVNNETGVVQPLADAARIARLRGLSVHCDAVQAPGRLAIDFLALGADTLALSAHKMGGPKGIGVLVIRDGLDIEPLILGGGQERRRRAGTENVAAIAGFGAAADAARRDLATVDKVRALRDGLEQAVIAITPEARIIGWGARERLANTSAIALPGALAETLVIRLDLAGIAVSAGAACSSGKVGPSRVIAAMGLAPEIVKSVIRVSIGPTTTQADIAAFLAAWREIAVTRKEARNAA
jgi:cysteine desulfurase